MSAPETAMRRVTAINNGTVIDHIPAGKALLVLKMLGLDAGLATPVSLGFGSKIGIGYIGTHLNACLFECHYLHPSWL